MKFQFPLIVFSRLDYELFLKSNKPEEVVLAILADIKHDDPEIVVQRIISRIDETSQSDFSLKRYFQQLRVLAQLRSLESQIDTTMDSIAEYFSEERDVLYIRGFRKAKEQFVKRMIQKMNLTVEQIAEIAEVPTDFVLTVKADLAKKPV